MPLFFYQNQQKQQQQQTEERTNTKAATTTPTKSKKLKINNEQKPHPDRHVKNVSKGRGEGGELVGKDDKLPTGHDFIGHSSCSFARDGKGVGRGGGGGGGRGS